MANVLYYIRYALRLLLIVFIVVVSMFVTMVLLSIYHSETIPKEYQDGVIIIHGVVEDKGR